MNFHDRIRSIIAERGETPAPPKPKPPQPDKNGWIEPDTLAYWFDNNKKWRLSSLSEATGVSEESLAKLLTRQNGYTCGPAPMHWWSYCALLKEPCLDATMDFVQQNWRELQHS